MCCYNGQPRMFFNELGFPQLAPLVLVDDRMTIETIFKDPSIQAHVRKHKACFKDLDRAIHTYADMASLDMDAVEIDDSSNAAIETLLQGLSGLEQALLLHDLRCYVSKVLEDELLTGTPGDAITEAYTNALASKIIWQITYQHFNENELGTIKVLVKGEVVAYFKPGHLRREHDQFLYDLFLQVKTMMALPEDFTDVFLPVRACDMPQAVLPPVDLIESQRVIHLAERVGKRFKQVEILLDPKTGIADVIPGAMQAALPGWTVDTAPPKALDILYMMSLLCMLSARDIKLDAIKGAGTGTIVDCEDFLWEKVSPRGEKLPNLHIPFHTALSHTEVSPEDWHSLAEALDKIDEDALLAFIRDIELPDHALSSGRSTSDRREDCVVKSPVFQQGKLLADEQVALFQSNLLKLKQVVAIIVETKKAGKVFDLLAMFSPEWHQAHLIHHALSQACRQDDSPLRRYFKTEALEYAQRVTHREPSPDDLVGTSVTPPLPYDAFWDSDECDSLRSSYEKIGLGRLRPRRERDALSQSAPPMFGDTVTLPAPVPQASTSVATFFQGAGAGAGRADEQRVLKTSSDSELEVENRHPKHG